MLIFSLMNWEDPSSILKEIGNCRFHTGLLHKKDLVGDLCESFTILGLPH